MPAEKKSAFAGPVEPPLPNVMVHSPLIDRALPAELSSWPRNAPVSRLKPLMRPSPKFPIRRARLNLPKCPGARAMPHGEFSGPLETSRRNMLPAVSNTSTKPWPGPARSSCFASFCSAKGDTQVSIDVADAKRCVPRGNAGVGERLHQLKMGVVHLNNAVVEIRSIEKAAT